MCYAGRRVSVNSLCKDFHFLYQCEYQCNSAARGIANLCVHLFVVFVCHVTDCVLGHGRCSQLAS